MLRILTSRLSLSLLGVTLSFGLGLAQASAKMQPDAPPAAEQPAADRPDAAQVDAVVLRVVTAGLAGDFDKYLEELLPDRRETAEQRSQLKRYEWKRFSGQATWYVADAAKPAVTITQRQPQNSKKIKLFVKDLHNKGAMPRPIELTWLAGRWWISANSL